MGLRRSLRTAHRDGYRVRAVARDNWLAIFICLIAGGKVVSRKRVWRIEEHDVDGLIQHYPEWNRRAKLLAALMRTYNEGADQDELGEAFLAADAFRRKHAAEIPFDIVAVESEETHVRTYLLPNGNYLRVHEDEIAEELTPQQMAELAELCEAADADDPLL